MRVHELAKTLKISSSELLEKFSSMGIKAKNHMASLDEAAVARIKKRGPAKTQTKKAGVKKVSLKPKATTPAPKAEVPKKQPEKQTSAPSFSEAKRLPAPVTQTESKSQSPVFEIPAVRPAASVVAAPIRLSLPVTVGNLASKLNVKVSDLIKALMGLGVFANVNQLLGGEIVFKVSSQLGIPVEELIDEDEKKLAGPTEEEEKDKLAVLRPPVVTLMGHVDHGKTSLLDAIRKTNVAAREAGQITQHIGAYGVDLPGKGHVTFLDTPGHAAFTAMRARGANVTDVVVLVVAADDGVMPQTIEAIDHAREAGVPIVVAVNKCDLPQANPQKAMMQLQKIELVAEEWGGKTLFCKVSAKTGEGIDHLLEMLLLEAEVLELKANPEKPAQGAIIEGRLTKGSGPVATVIVQKGTLRMGDVVLSGPFSGKVRALKNDRGKIVREAGPSYAVEIHGLNGVPEAGETFHVVEDEKVARRIAEKRTFDIRERALHGSPKHLSLEDLHEKIKEGAVKELKLIIKADVQGSVEVLTQSLEKLSTDAVRLHVIHGGVGGVNESDVMLAAASNAIIIGFHVKTDARSQELTEKERVDARFYNIIYEAVDDVRKAMEGLLEPVFHEVLEGRAEIRRVFQSSKMGAIGGAMVIKGKITRSSRIRVVRNQIVMHEGRLASLKRFKDDAREVAEGFECGMAVEGFKDIQERDLVEAFRMEKGPSPKLK